MLFSHQKDVIENVSDVFVDRLDVDPVSIAHTVSNCQTNRHPTDCVTSFSTESKEHRPARTNQRQIKKMFFFLFFSLLLSFCFVFCFFRLDLLRPFSFYYYFLFQVGAVPVGRLLARLLPQSHAIVDVAAAMAQLVTANISGSRGKRRKRRRRK